MMHRPLPNRPQDYFYDGVYTVSSRRDHVKQMTAAQTHTVVIVPEYRNMFARALNYPSAHVEYRGHPLPRNFGQNRLELRRGDPQVTGMNRFKYFRKPFVPFLSPSGGQVVYAKRIAKKDAAAALEQQQQQARAPSPLVKTVAVQTAYRESGTQTEPYSPDYVIPPGTQPEILALATLTWNAGLPAGVAELDMIERARAKRAWEATLPEVTDEESFDKRLKMMEEMELREWTEREAEIKRLQDARLDILTKLIRKREVENEELNNERIEKIWQKKLQERDSLHEKIERKRIKALRMLDERRKNVDNIVERRDIIADYADYTSRVYAPKARDGIFRDQADGTLQLRDTGMMTFDGLEHIESTIPENLSKPDYSIPTHQAFPTPSARRELQMQERLRLMDQKLKERKTQKTPEKAPLKYAHRIEKPVQRPSTPRTRLPDDPEEDDKYIAAICLQRIIRGRFAQNVMYQGKERRLQLINELRTRRTVQRAEEEAAIASSSAAAVAAAARRAKSAGASSARPSEAASRPSSVPTSVDSPSSGTSDETFEAVVERGASAGTVRSRQSVDERPRHGGAELDPMARARELEMLSATAEVRQYDDIAPEMSESDQLERLYEMAIEGEFVGQALDFFSKELVRLREERRIMAMVKLAERERRMREAEESGTRQAELKRRREEDELFRQVMSVHQETMDTYLEDLLLEGVENTVTVQAREQVHEFAAHLNRVVDRLEQRTPENNVADLVFSFLLPEVEKQTIRDRVKVEQQKYILAAHRAIYEQVSTTMDIREQPAEISSVADAANSSEEVRTGETPPGSSGGDLSPGVTVPLEAGTVHEDAAEAGAADPAVDPALPSAEVHPTEALGLEEEEEAVHLPDDAS